MLAYLRVHSHFSMLQATPSIKQIMKRAVEDGHTAVALTDMGVLYGAVNWVKAGLEEGLKPLVGLTLQVKAPGGRSGHPGPSGELVLLARNHRGFQSLCELSYLIQSPHQDGPLSWDQLSHHVEGLICLTGGLNCISTRYLISNQPNYAARYLSRVAGLFRDDGYLSLEIHRDKDRGMSQGLLELADRFGIKPVAVQPVYCMFPADRPRLRLLTAIRENIPLHEVLPDQLPGHGRPDRDLHWLDKQEFLSRFERFPAALENIRGLVDRCGIPIQLGKAVWPKVPLPEGTTAEERLRTTAWEALKNRYPQPISGRIRKRFERELDQITGKGFSPLFLLVGDLVRYAEKSDIPYGSRGSVSNSLIAYCLGISKVDPIEHNLLFERFLNPERPDLPDIDLDFCSRRRDEILTYAIEAYGRDRVALVSTINTLRMRSAVREVAKAYGYREQEIKRLADKIPRRWHPDPRRRTRTKLREILDGLGEPTDREIVEQASALVGKPDHLSLHPGGVLFTPGPLTEYLPIQVGASGHAVAQLDRLAVEAMGLPKVDLLGNRALSVIAEVERMIEDVADTGESSQELQDQGTAELLTCAETIGIFQCESEGARRTLRKLGAKNVSELAIANAFFKPGPATGGMADTFIRRFRGQEPVAYLHPSLEPILENTMGVLLFQEQVLRVAVEVAGLSWGEADILRRGMTKFRPDVMDQLKNKFISGCCAPPTEGAGMDQQSATLLWEQVRAFSGYGFNQGHATSYAQISYQMARYKALYPAAFLCARLNVGGGYHHPAVYMQEANRYGYPVHPPHVNVSECRFSLNTHHDEAVGKDGVAIWMGLEQVRDLRRSAIAEIIQLRRDRLFAGVQDLVDRVRLQRRELRNLICCGGLDGLGKSRNAMLQASAEPTSQEGSSQLSFWDGRLDSIDSEGSQQRFDWEMEILGSPVSVTPLDLVHQEGLDAMRVSNMAMITGESVWVAGYRIPGWPGGDGFFLADEGQYIQVKLVTSKGEKKTQPGIWIPIVLEGHWEEDRWGMGWFRARSWREISTASAGT